MTGQQPQLPLAESTARTPNNVRRKLNKYSPLVAAAPVLPGALIFLFFFTGGSVARLGPLGIPLGILAAVLITLGVCGIQYLQWKKLDFWFDDAGDLRIDSGIIYRNERKLQLSRLQAVDVVQPLVPRIFGMATIKIEVAGSGDTKAVLSYLTLPEAEQLRREILSRAAGEAHEVAVSVPEAPEIVVAVVPVQDLALSLILRTSTAGLLAASVLIVFTTYLTEGAGGLSFLVFTGGVPLFMIVTEFAALYGFTVAQAGDGLRLRHGLVSTQAHFVPPGRVQAVEFIEPLLWRPLGWVRIKLTVAGAGGDGDSDSNNSQNVLLPVAKWDVAMEIFNRIMAGVDLAAIQLDQAPRRARWRSPIQWSRLACGHNDLVFVARRGYITRYLAVVPHARTQSVRVTQGPWQRALDLASMWVDVPPGPVMVVAEHRPCEQARQIAEAQIVRARKARSEDKSTRWAAHTDN